MKEVWLGRLGSMFLAAVLGGCAHKGELRVFAEEAQDEMPVYLATYGFESAPRHLAGEPCESFQDETLPSTLSDATPLKPLGIATGGQGDAFTLQQIGWDPKFRWVLFVPLYPEKCTNGATEDAWALVHVHLLQGRIQLVIRDQQILVPNNVGDAYRVDDNVPRWRERGCVDGDRRRVLWPWCGRR